MAALGPDTAYKECLGRFAILAHNDEPLGDQVRSRVKRVSARSVERHRLFSRSAAWSKNSARRGRSAQGLALEVPQARH